MPNTKEWNQEIANLCMVRLEQETRTTPKDLRAFLGDNIPSLMSQVQKILGLHDNFIDQAWNSLTKKLPSSPLSSYGPKGQDIIKTDESKAIERQALLSTLNRPSYDQDQSLLVDMFERATPEIKAFISLLQQKIEQAAVGVPLISLRRRIQASYSALTAIQESGELLSFHNICDPHTYDETPEFALKVRLPETKFTKAKVVTAPVARPTDNEILSSKLFLEYEDLLTLYLVYELAQQQRDRYQVLESIYIQAAKRKRT